ncbi:hypothetical protein V6Z11_A05G438600 [Gossypium hirsutum]
MPASQQPAQPRTRAPRTLYLQGKDEYTQQERNKNEEYCIFQFLIIFSFLSGYKAKGGIHCNFFRIFMHTEAIGNKKKKQSKVTFCFEPLRLLRFFDLLPSIFFLFVYLNKKKKGIREPYLVARPSVPFRSVLIGVRREICG